MKPIKGIMTDKQKMTYNGTRPSSNYSGMFAKLIYWSSRWRPESRNRTRDEGQFNLIWNEILQEKYNWMKVMASTEKGGGSSEG